MNAEEIEQVLRAWCEERGHVISGIGEVSEPVAALLLGVSAAALRLWINEGRSPLQPTRRYARHRWYPLHTIAAFLADSEKDAQHGLD
ncbi:hypothetical protein [Paraburkholderia sp. BR13444]|uniref:hypothetical protein n=1 Tax=Paraburkholderia sp. BR13444 TaxID=3236997 RepID=UPI0034CD6A35